MNLIYKLINKSRQKDKYSLKKFFYCMNILLLTSVAFIISCYSYYPIKSINFEGSTTMKPLINKLINSYIKSKPNIDINLQAGGSTSGLIKLIKQKTDIANISDDSSVFANSNHFQKDWQEQKLKTVTIAFDGIGLLYKKPKNCAPLNITKKNINRIYDIFSGHKSTDLGRNQYNYKQLAGDSNSWCSSNINITAYSRSGGASKSGTASSFIYRNNLFDIDKYKDTNSSQYKGLISGNYGEDFTLYHTAEANSEAWSYFKQNQQSGTMIYFSLSFILNNWSIIKKEGFSLAGLEYNSKNLNEQEIIDINPGNWKELLKEKYVWYRPLNTIISLDHVNHDIKKLYETILIQNDKTIESLYLKPLNNAEKKMMGIDLSKDKHDEKWSLFWSTPDFVTKDGTKYETTNVFGAYLLNTK